MAVGTKLVSLILHAVYSGVRRLGLLARFVAIIFSPFVSQFHVCACFITICTANFLVISLQLSSTSRVVHKTVLNKPQYKRLELGSGQAYDRLSD
jgi:hypothetical protein